MVAFSPRRSRHHRADAVGENATLKNTEIAVPLLANFKSHKYKWTNPESTQARITRGRVTGEDEPEMFGEDAIPRPSRAPRKSKSQCSSTSSSATSSSSKNRLTEFFQEQIQLDREAKKESLNRELAAKLAVVELQKRNENLKILTFDTTGMNPEDAARIEALKEKLKDHQDAFEKLVRQQAEAFQLQFDTLRAELQATRGLLQNQQGGGEQSPQSMRLDVLKFSGNDLDRWIFVIIEYFSLLNTPADQHLRIVEFNLEGAAVEWFRWMTKNGLITTWARFEESVKNRSGPSKYEDPRGALSKLLQLGTVEDYQREFEKLMNRVRDTPDSLLISFYISGLKLSLQHVLLVSRPTTLGDAFSLARIIEARFEAIAKKEKEHIVKKKTDAILPLQSELASPKIKGSINADEDIGGEALGVGEDDDSGNVATGEGDDAVKNKDISILNSLIGHGSPLHKEEKDEGCNAKKIMGSRNQDNFFKHHLEDKVVFKGVESVTPMLSVVILGKCRYLRNSQSQRDYSYGLKVTVGIKRLLDDLGVTAAKLMLLVYKLLLLVFRVNAAITKSQLLKRLRLLEDFLLSEKR
ncbi:ty3-gypsy retrotransposon protein [Tanacetum coccineum]